MGISIEDSKSSRTKKLCQSTFLVSLFIDFLTAIQKWLAKELWLTNHRFIEKRPLVIHIEH